MFVSYPKKQPFFPPNCSWALLLSALTSQQKIVFQLNIFLFFIGFPKCFSIKKVSNHIGDTLEHFSTYSRKAIQMGCQLNGSNYSLNCLRVNSLLSAVERSYKICREGKASETNSMLFWDTGKTMRVKHYSFRYFVVESNKVIKGFHSQICYWDPQIV